MTKSNIHWLITGAGAMLNLQNDAATGGEQKLTITPLYCLYKKNHQPLFYSRPIREFDYLNITVPCSSSGFIRSNNSKRQYEISGDIIAITVSGNYNYHLVARIKAITAMPPRRQKTA